MTLAAVWIESTPRGNHPLCFASDSRTTPGPIDGVTKVMLFAREDLAAVWAGDFRYAMLVSTHLDAVFSASDAMRRRDVDVAQALVQASKSMHKHLERSLHPTVPMWQLNTGAQTPDPTTVVVGGYSIVERAHVVLQIQWRQGQGGWSTKIWQVEPRDLIVIGDDRKGARQVARQARVYRPQSAGDTWHMEPLAAVHNACEDLNKRTIGGAVQLAKAYAHGSTRAYGLVGPVGDRAVSVLATQVNARAAQELRAAGLVVDLSTWRLSEGCYAGGRFAIRRDSLQ